MLPTMTHVGSCDTITLDFKWIIVSSNMEVEFVIWLLAEPNSILYHYLIVCNSFNYQNILQLQIDMYSDVHACILPCCETLIC